MKKCLILCTLGYLSAMPAQSAVVAGDLAVVGYQADGTDQFWILVLNDIAAGETFSFTDHGWFSSGSFRTNEGSSEYTVGTALAAGDILNIGVSEGVGSSPNFSASGDQVIIFTGTVATPTMVYGLNNEGTGVWQADATSSNDSALPAGLINGESAVALNEVDNASFDFANNPGPYTAAEWLSLIGNNSNWTGGDAEGDLVPPPSSVVVTPIPEPSSALLGGIALLGLLRRRR